jgi:hypothetical protein
LREENPFKQRESYAMSARILVVEDEEALTTLLQRSGAATTPTPV